MTASPAPLPFSGTTTIKTPAGQPFNPWNYGHDLASAGIAGKIGCGPYVLLHAIAAHADAKGHAFPSISCLQKDTGLSRGMVSTHINTLIECGAIARDPRPLKGQKRNESSVYAVLPIENIRPTESRERRRQQPTPMRSRSVNRTPDRCSDDRTQVFDLPNARCSDDRSVSVPLVTTHISIPVESEDAPAREGIIDMPSTETDVQRLVNAAGAALGWEKIPPRKYSWWAKDAAAALKVYPLDDLLRCLAWFMSDGYWRDHATTFSLSKAIDAVEDWRSKGKPASMAKRAAKAEAVPNSFQSASGPRKERPPDGDVLVCIGCGRVEGSRHNTERCGRSGAITAADAVWEASDA